MEEYEYNFKVKSIDPYINYCKKNNYIEQIVKQNRIVYESSYNDNLIARITTNNNEETILDFKNVNQNDDLLKISNESLPLKVDNLETVYSILDTLNFKKKSNLLRTRYIYKKDDFTFEIDDYTEPVMKVVAIEGNKSKVDQIYNEIKDMEDSNE